MKECNIKKMQSEDIESCSKLFYEVFTSEEWKFNWLTMGKAYDYFTDLFNTPNFIGFLLESEGEVIGACVGTGNTHFVNNQYEIKEIFIHPNLQNKGFGSLFLNEVENTLREMSYDMITLYTQRNIPAHDFYNSREYITLKDTVHMTKIL